MAEGSRRRLRQGWAVHLSVCGCAAEAGVRLWLLGQPDRDQVASQARTPPQFSGELKSERRMSRLTKEIEEHYLQGIERERLSSNEGELERLRTQSILSRFLPPAPAVVLDIGGGAGIYAFPLAQMGYQVHLIDPVELHLEQARAHSHESGARLASIGSGNACKLD